MSSNALLPGKQLYFREECSALPWRKICAKVHNMHPVLKTLIQRLALGLFTLIVVSMIVFASVELLPGDFAYAILGADATPESVAAFQKEIGLDRPATTRYFEWITNALQGDFGTSYTGQGVSTAEGARNVVDVIHERLVNTLFLATMAAAISVPLAVSLGLLAALYRNSWFDRLVNTTALTSVSFPEFFVGYILIIVFAVNLRWFPSLSLINEGMSLADRIVACALPALTLTLTVTAHMMRMTRAAIINILASPYIEMAQLKGVSKSMVILQHALPNAWAPIINVIAFNLAHLVVGVVLVEVVFVYPGVGQLMVDSVLSRDIPVVQACALIFAATYIILNLLADIVSIISNPRLLHPK
jgi:peptide/nickel transport system permease protein